MRLSDSVVQILIIDEQPVTRLGLRVLLESETDLRVCGEAHDLVGAVQQLKATSPHVVIADIGLNGSACGLDVIQRLRAADPHLPVLAYSMLDDLHYVERSLAAGAIGFCSKRESPAVVLAAVRQVVAGNLSLNEDLTSRLLSRAINGRRPGLDSGVQMLSNRELEVFALIGRGPNPEAAKSASSLWGYLREELDVTPASAAGSRVEIEVRLRRHRRNGEQ